jgi:hypothetical protein
MRLISTLDLVVIASVTTLACTAPSEMEPFDATLPASLWLEATDGRCVGLTGTVTGSGEATPGGPFTFEGSHCLEPQPGDSSIRPFILLTDGRFVFNFVSGTTLAGTLTGSFFLRETGLYNIQAELWFTGGTGRFVLADRGGGGVSIVQVGPKEPTLDRQTGQGTNVAFSGVIHP